MLTDRLLDFQMPIDVPMDMLGYLGVMLVVGQGGTQAQAVNTPARCCPPCTVQWANASFNMLFLLCGNVKAVYAL